MVINLAKGLDRDKFKSIVCCLNSKGKFADELEKEGIRVIELKKRWKFDFSVIKKLIEIIKENKINIVHTHLWGANFWGRLAAQKASVPVIISTEHNSDTWKTPLHFVIDRYLAAKTDRIIAVSKSVKEFYVKNVGIPSGKIEVIYNGISISEHRSQITEHSKSHSVHSPQSTVHSQDNYIRKQLAISPDETVIAMIGRLVPQKGHKDFLLALKVLTGCGFKVKGLIVGSGPQEMYLKQVCDNLALNGNVIFTGVRSDIPELFKAIDMIALPSTREGFPMIILEAMSAGVPVVASSVGGVPEVITNGFNGLLVEPENHTELKAAFAKLIHDERLSNSLIDNARATVAKEFNLRNMIDSTQGLYEKIYESKLPKADK